MPAIAQLPRSIEPTFTLHTSFSFEGNDYGFDMWCTEDVQEDFRGHTYIYEPEVISAILNFARPGDICIDAGANLGYHSLLMSQLVGENGEVLAFEPDPGCADKFNANIGLNGSKNICMLPVALWSEPTDILFYLAECTGYSSFLNYTNIECSPIKVRADKLDNVIDVKGIRPIRLMKLDCEGAEEHILRGGKKLLERGVACVIVEFNTKIMPYFKTSDRQIRDYMASLGYDMYFLQTDGSPPERIPLEANIKIISQHFHFNAMFARPCVEVNNWQPWKIL